jgi:hypothetical protein
MRTTHNKAKSKATAGYKWQLQVTSAGGGWLGSWKAGVIGVAYGERGLHRHKTKQDAKANWHNE